MRLCGHRHYVKKGDHIDLHTCTLRKGHETKHTDGRLFW